MKKFFEKHDLFKILFAVILLVAILTWIIPVGNFSGSEFVSSGVSRIGILDVFLGGLYSFNYFLQQITFILILGGFYGVVSNISGYQKLIEVIVKKLKGKEIIFVVCTSFIIAGLISIFNDIYPLLVFVPFVISIIRKLGLNKFTAFATTFAAILVGIIGATYSTYSLANINDYLQTTYNTEILVKVIIFVLSFAIVTFFNIVNVKKALADKKSVSLEDKFETEVKTDKKTKTLPIIIGFAILLIFIVLGYISWNGVFGIKCFENFHSWWTALSIKDVTVLSSLIGNSSAFGSWDIFSIQAILIIMSFVLAKIYHVKADNIIENFLNGAKKMLRLAIIIVLIYMVFVLTYWSPIVPTIANFFAGITSKFNVYFTALTMFIASILNVDLGFIAYSLGSFFVTSYAANTNVIMIVMNAVYGFVQFIAPTSVILMLGLAYLNISYKEYFKKMWKYLLILLAVLLIIFTIIAFI